MVTDRQNPAARRERGGTGSGPVTESARITSLDLIRGVAVLGILLMNAVAMKMGLAPYLNLDAGGSETAWDWAVGIFGEIFVDQKFMGLFSLLFGAGILLFIERAEARESHPILLSLWRNALLLGIGVLHTLLWEGDVLVVYALSAVILVALRKLSARALIAIGAAAFLLSVPNTLLMQHIVDTADVLPIGIWDPVDEQEAQMPGQIPIDGTPAAGHARALRNTMEELIMLGYLLRGLGLILMGAGLYRMGFMNGAMPARVYRLSAAIGLGVGLSLATVGVVITALGDYSREVAFIGQVPNSLGTIPASLGYMSLIILWNRSRDHWLKRRLLATGRMALTNYLSQTILGVLILNVLLGDVAATRIGILIFCLGVWGLQLWWSPAWLGRFRFGPAEWLWRVGTYRRGQPLRRPSHTVPRADSHPVR